MKVREFIEGRMVSEGTVVRIYASGEPDTDGIQVGTYYDGNMDFINEELSKAYMESEIVNIGAKDSTLILECGPVSEAQLLAMAGITSASLEIENIMTLSVRHIQPCTYTMLMSDAPEAMPSLPRYRKMECGTRDVYGVYVYADKAGIVWDDLPQDLKHIIRLAHAFGCSIICFDPDGPVIEGVEEYC